MRLIFPILFVFVFTAQLQAQPLVNTTWRADTALMTAFSGGGHLDSLFISFNSGNTLWYEAYDTTADSASKGVWWQINDTTFGWVDTAHKAYALASVCTNHDTAIINYRAHSTYLSMTHTNDQCTFRGTVLTGSRWYGNNAITAVNSPNLRSFTILPNPFTDKIDIQINGKNSSPVYYQVYDVQGRIRRRGMITSGTEIFTIDNLKDLQNGVYYLKLEEDNYVGHFQLVKL